MLAAWIYTHPWIRRIWLMFQLLWGGSLAAVLTAPHAAAESVASALSWSGLHDSYGIPVGAHIVSTVSMLEAIREQTHVTPDPNTWVPALASGTATAVTYTGLANFLAAESAVLAFVVTIGVWFVKFALSTLWLGWLADLAHPILAQINTTMAQLLVVPGTFLICAAVGGFTAITRGVGRGLGIILGGVLVLIGGEFLLSDPASEVTGDNGILGIGRALGFRVSQGVANNGPLAPGGVNGQADRLTSWLVDVLDREQVELVQFGRVIDDNPVCRDAYNAALMHVSPTDPVHSIKACAPDALAHAQQLGASTAAVFGLVILLIVVVLAAVDYDGPVAVDRRELRRCPRSPRRGHL